METLEERIARRLHEAVELAERTGLTPAPDMRRGLAVVGDGGEAVLVLTIEDAARIAAQEAQGWF